MPFKHHAKIFCRIGILAVITMVFAGIIFLFPKPSLAPKGEDAEVHQPPASLEEPSAFTLPGISDHDHIHPKQVISGKAPGFWFFEGSFPVTLRDINGTPFATVIAQTSEDWMVTKNVDFTITMPETFTYSGVGSILFKKDDPSDGEAPFDPEKDQKIIPVIFDNE